MNKLTDEFWERFRKPVTTEPELEPDWELVADEEGARQERHVYDGFAEHLAAIEKTGSDAETLFM